uniref:Uncharacterized protein n=1 Tax=Ixodes ricinus TaxID=34613 RepID=A0A6B0UXS1_IXORI
MPPSRRLSSGRVLAYAWSAASCQTVSPKVALRAGSSRHGKALRADVGSNWVTARRRVSLAAVAYELTYRPTRSRCRGPSKSRPSVALPGRMAPLSCTCSWSCSGISCQRSTDAPPPHSRARVTLRFLACSTRKSVARSTARVTFTEPRLAASLRLGRISSS